MVQFCYLGQYLGIKTVSYCQLLRMAIKDGQGLKLEKVGLSFWRPNALRAKITNKYYSECSLMKFQFDIFFKTLQEHIIYG